MQYCVVRNKITQYCYPLYMYILFLIKNSSYTCNDWSKVLQNMWEIFTESILDMENDEKMYGVSSFSTFLLPFPIVRLIIWFTVDFPNLCPLSNQKKRWTGKEWNKDNRIAMKNVEASISFDLTTVNKQVRKTLLKTLEPAIRAE